MTGKLFGLIGALQAMPLISPHRRAQLLRFSGATIGNNTRISQGCFFGAPRFTIGDDAFISVQCLFDGSESIELGDGVYLAPRVHLVTASHEFGGPAQRAGAAKNAPIKIGDGCWIGAEAMIMPGVTIASGCVIAAGALVTKDTEPNGIYVGRPAVRTRGLN